MQQLQGRIGRALATRFATDGMKLVLADVEAAYREFGVVHLLCNCGGVAVPVLLQPAWKSSLADWQWTMSVNLMGVVHGLRAFVPRVLDGGDEGHVVNTASVAGLLTGSGPYFASKHAVTCVTGGLYKDFRAMGARLSASVLCPGVIRTAILDAERNRPAHFGAATDLSTLDEGAQRWAAACESVAAGIEPSVVADAVAEAVMHDRFYIVPAQPEFLQSIGLRMADIQAQRNPAWPPPRD